MYYMLKTFTYVSGNHYKDSLRPIVNPVTYHALIQRQWRKYQVGTRNYQAGKYILWPTNKSLALWHRMTSMIVI